MQIEVTPNDADETFETSLHCSQNDCRRIVDIDSDSPQSLQSVSCPKHGFLTSFPHRNALGEFVRLLANKVLAADGHELIQADAASVFGDIETPARIVH